MFDLFLIVGITVAAMASPGPDMFLLMRNGLLHGWRVGFATVIGICLGLSVHLGLSILGLVWIITTNVYLYQGIQLLGAGYLIYLGIQALRSKGSAVVDLKRKKETKTFFEGLNEGLLCNLLNPKVTIFIFSIFTQFITPEDSTLFRLACGATILLTVFTCWSLFVFVIQNETLRSRITGSSLLLDRIFGGLLLALGLRIAFIRD